MPIDPSARRERARRFASDYAASQRERDKQSEDRDYQRMGSDSPGRETMNRDRERVERPTLSEQKDVERKLHSSNTESGRPKPLAKPQRRN
mgnify:CR=1 FL=1